jgi:hypothetical protein
LTLSQAGFLFGCNSDEDKVLLFNARINIEFFLLLFSYKEGDDIIKYFKRLIIFEFPFSFQASSHAFASLSILHTSFFAWFVIDGVLLDLFDYGFLLDFSLESFKCALERFAFFNDNKCQRKSPPYKMMGEFNQFPGDCQAPI